MALNGNLILNGANYVPLNLCEAIPNEEVKRGLFRLHPGRLSQGCITLVHNSDLALIRNALLQTDPMPIPCMKSLMALGWIEVIANGN